MALREIAAGKVTPVECEEKKGAARARRREEVHAVGDHTVIFGGQGERLELIHRAQGRDSLARGALRAAVWIERQPPGLYSMRDVLGL
jgi:4-hydroxy-tetrahydrodipicolinate reductase